MTSVYDTIIASTSPLRECKKTEHGVRIRTTCMFPSFEPAFVYVEKSEKGFVVHDAGETVAVITAHGQEGDAANEVIRTECKKYDLAFDENVISLEVDDVDWLQTAVVSVATAAVFSAKAALALNHRFVAKAQNDLVDVIYQLLAPKIVEGTISKRFSFKGMSGRQYKFDLAVQNSGRLTLIETVTAHKNSVNSKYVSMADVPSDGVMKIVAHNDDLSKEHIQLLRNVANVASQSGVMDLMEGSQTLH